jgi:lipopolysaccharide/colanic/teichoic acid biosynthesis glycosyltransferase
MQDIIEQNAIGRRHEETHRRTAHSSATRVVTALLPGTSLELHEAGETTLYSRWLKGVLDRSLAALLLISLLPLMATIAVAVRLTLGGPVIYRQERVGLSGKTFVMYKFRTMRPDRRHRASDIELERRHTHKHPQDPRLVPLGRILRKLSLDELPQLVNVLRGEMSLVGPRPEMVSIVATYQPWQHERHMVKPGLTGLWQVTERSSQDTRMHEHTGLDIDYVRRQSLGLDLKLLLLTIPCLLGLRRGF